MRLASTIITYSFTLKSNRFLLYACFSVLSDVIFCILRVEENHGIPLVSKAMAYTVASGTGLSDLEMEEVLSMDKTVLKGSFAINHSPNRRFPTVLWLKVERLYPQVMKKVISFNIVL